MKKSTKVAPCKLSKPINDSNKIMDSAISELTGIVFENKRDVARLFLYMKEFAREIGKEKELQKAVKTVIVNEKKRLSEFGEWNEKEIKKLRTPKIIRKSADEFKLKTGKVYNKYKAMDKSKVIKIEVDRFTKVLDNSNLDLATNLVDFPGRIQSEDNNMFINHLLSY